MNFIPDRVGQFPFRKLDAQERKKNFTEVQLPYTEEEVIKEAERCLLCGTPVCIDACPVLLDVRGMNEAVARGDMDTAYKRIRETNVLLGVTARCCPQLQGLCEDACVMRWEGQPIGIGLIQRYIADWERNKRNNNKKQQQQQKEDVSVLIDTGKEIAVIGAGPAGIAAAELLKRYGHNVTIYEECPSPGGTALLNIPEYHLPKDVLNYEIDKIKDMGVKIKTSIKIGEDISLSQLKDSSNGILITTGSKDVKRLDTPGINLNGIYNGYQFLEKVYSNGVQQYIKKDKNKYNLGTNIIVIGGGDTALDCARTALRLSQGNVTVLYRRTENDLPCDPIMLEESKEEGIKFMFLVEPKSYEGFNDHITKIKLNQMQLGQPDESGRRSPLPIPGKEFEIKCSSVILAIGRGPNSFLQKSENIKTSKNNSIAIDDRYKTSIEGVFAAGDVTTGETLIVKAMSSGREAAQRLHEYIMNLEDYHVSFYERYYKNNIYDRMLKGDVNTTIPPS